MTPALRHGLVIGLLVVGVVGIGVPLHFLGCGTTETGQTTFMGKPVTTQQATEGAQAAGEVAKVVAVAAGYPQASVWIDMAVRLAAVLAAWLIRPPRAAPVSTG